MNTPDYYAGTAEQDISSAVTGAHDFAETIRSASVYALLAVAAAINPASRCGVRGRHATHLPAGAALAGVAL
jgi:hypothetical protein